MIIDKNNYNINAFQDVNLITTESKKTGPKRLAHLEESLNHISIDGAVLEFGVFSGATINLISDILSNDIVHGFDSFEGLPEDWFMKKKEKQKGNAKRHKGYFAVDTLPEVNNNVQLWKGWFDTTIPEYLKTTSTNIKFLHIDCDLYSSTRTIFNLLNNYIVSGTIIVFDEFYPWGHGVYDLWEEHEYKALKEWVEEHNRRFEIISRNDFQQCTIKIV
jgi:hypothetical protein